MITKIIVGVLLCCLVTVVGLFLYSDYRLHKESVSTTALDNIANDSIISNNYNAEKSSVKKSTNTNGLNDLSDAAGTTATQPDKSLPIPAHQLKKLIADKSSNSELDQKIQAANEAIAALDKALPEQIKTAEPNSVIENAEGADEKSEEIKQRLQNIRDHLDKQP
jgi:hypothetical protein